MLDFTGYIVEEKIEIDKRHLIPKQIKDHSLKNSEIKFRDSGIKLLVESYTKEAGVRNLERQIANVCRKVATQIASGNKKSISISQIMSKNLITCDLNTSVTELMDEMTEKKIRHILIMEDKKLLGIVSIGDVVNHLIAKIKEENKNLKDYINSY